MLDVKDVDFGLIGLIRILVQVRIDSLAKLVDTMERVKYIRSCAVQPIILIAGYIDLEGSFLIMCESQISCTNDSLPIGVDFWVRRSNVMRARSLVPIHGSIVVKLDAARKANLRYSDRRYGKACGAVVNW